MQKLFYVDKGMCGGDELPGEFDLADFCEKLQGKLSGVEVVPVLDERDRGFNRNPQLVPWTIFDEALGEYLRR
jgi:hypothetical protein